MKKMISVLLAASMMLSATACSSGTTQATQAQTSISAETSAKASEEEKKTDAAVSGSTIKIGSIQDLSASTAVMGIALSEGIKWHVQEINANGGVNGKQLELVEYDSKASVDESVNAYNRLVQEGAVAVIGPLQSNIGIAMASIAEDAGMPYLTIANDNRVTRQGDDGTGTPWKYMFTSQPSLNVMGAIMAKYAINELGYTKFGVIHRSDNAYSQALRSSFAAYCAENGGTIVAEQAFLSTDTDYKTMLGKLIKEDIDCIFCPNYTQELVVLTQQARALGYEGVMFNGLDAAPPFSSMCGPEAENVIFLSNVDLEGEDVMAVAKAWAEATGNELPDQINKFCLGYDMAGMIAKALEGTDESRDSVRDALENLSGYEGLTGNVTMDPETHQPKPMEMIVCQVIDGKDTCLTSYGAEPVVK